MFVNIKIVIEDNIFIFTAYGFSKNDNYTKNRLIKQAKIVEAKVATRDIVIAFTSLGFLHFVKYVDATKNIVSDEPKMHEAQIPM